MEKKVTDDWTRNRVLSVIIAAAGTAGFSGLVKILGLYDYVYFNKTILSALAFGILFAAANRTISQFEEDRRRAVGTFVLAWFLAFTEELGMGMRLAFNNLPAVINLWTAFIMALTAIPAGFLIAPFFFWLAGKIKDKNDGEINTDTRNVFLFTWLAAFVGYLPCFFAFFPGLYCYDMIWQWQMYINRDFNTHHPLLHTLLSAGIIESGARLFGSYNAGLALHSLFQLIVLSGSVAFALRLLYKINVGKRIWTVAAVFYIFFPFIPALGLTTTKDVLFGCLFLDVFVGICDMIHSRSIYRGWRLAAFLLLVTLMGMFRNNAVYGLAFTAVCMLAAWLFTGRRSKDGKFLLRLTLILMVSVVLIEGGFAAAAKGLHAWKGSIAEMMSVPFQQMARTYVNHKEELAPEDKEELLLYFEDGSLDQYVYWVSDPVKSGFKESYFRDHKKAFVRLWIRLGLQFPGEYILAPLYNTMGIWYMGGDSSCYMEYKMSPPVTEDRAVEIRSLLPGLKNVYSWFTDENIQKHLPVVSLIFYTSFYSWVVFISAVFIIIRKKWIYLVMPLYCIGYILTLLLGPCLTVRYMLCVILCVPTLAAVVMRGMKDS